MKRCTSIRLSDDILIGIPSYNNEKTIAPVIQMVAHGLAMHYKDFQVKLWQENIVSIYRGPSGKGTALRSVFEAATRLQVKACAVVEPSDLFRP